MRHLSAFLQALALTAVSALAASPTSAAVAQLEPPVAAKRPHQVVSPHGSREDDFYWLRDDKRENPDVLNYLAAENAHTQRVMAGMKPLAERLYAEFLGRMKQDEDTVPSRLKTHWYYSRVVAGKEYSIKMRRKDSLDAPDQVLLDQNDRAANKPYYDLGAIEISQDEKLLAFSEDTVGRRLHVLRFKNSGDRHRAARQRRERCKLCVGQRQQDHPLC